MKVFFLVTLLTVAAMCDLFYAKIPNRVILWGQLLAYMYCLIFGEIDEIGKCFAGMCLPLLAGVVIYAFGVLGAGDIKLISIIGAFLGVRSVLGSIGYALVIGAVEGGIKLIVVKRRRRYPSKRVTVRFALPILLGTLGELMIQGGVTG